MGLYGQKECMYNEKHLNPYYLTKCNNPKVEKGIVKGEFCNNCKKVVLPEYGKDDLLENLVACLEGKKREMVKDYTLKVLKGVV
jgi:hypothetical protein